MNVSDSSVTAALAAAQEKISATGEAVVAEVDYRLLVLRKDAPVYRDRSQLASAQAHLLENRHAFLSDFAGALREQIAADLSAKRRTNDRADLAETDWQTIGLVDEGQIDERITFERNGHLIAHRCDTELRELDGYIATLMGISWADPQRNPLRGAVLGSAWQLAIDKLSDAPDTRKILARELGHALADAMPACYRAITVDLKQRGLWATDMSLRPADETHSRAPPPRPQPNAPSFDDARRAWESSWLGRVETQTSTPRSWENSLVGRRVDPVSDRIDPESSAALLDRLIRGGMPGSIGAAQTGTRSAEADLELTNLLRRLNGVATTTGELDASQTLAGTAGAVDSTRNGNADFAPTTGSGGLSSAYQFQPPSSGLAGLMAANLIRAHRNELMQGSRGEVDHLVIEVVSSLFDQILSDVRVPPQMARQIARLQLPVLRAALTDGSFFSSRRHPVRRFINRIASLACAFDQFETGPAKQLLVQVSGLVREIVEGDFTQLQLYYSKLIELERFVAEQTHAEIRESGAAETLRAKELEWRIQQRFSKILFNALEPLALPAFVRDFLAGVWAQAIVIAARREGDDGSHAQRLRRTGVLLVKSIQPKRTLEERKAFVVSLPGLMSELTDGMKFVDWPPAAQDDFFGQLIAQHAGSLKSPPRSDLDRNMLLRNLEAAFRTPVPSAEETPTAVEPPASTAPALEQPFTVAEGEAIGLISESEIDWSRHPANEARVGQSQREVSTPADSDAATDASGGPMSRDHPSLAGEGGPMAGAGGGDAPGVSPELLPGLQLRDHLHLGFSYQLNLKDHWEKVRLTYMSPGRTLFLFAYGIKGRETISMTARTLARLCESRRMRAFENAFLIDRATQRAREHLAGHGPVGMAAASPPA